MFHQHNKLMISCIRRLKQGLLAYLALLLIGVVITAGGGKTPHPTSATDGVTALQQP